VTEFLRVALALFLTVAPLGALPTFQSLTEPPGRVRAAIACSAAAFALLATFCLIAGELLDLLDVSPENFQLAAALIFLPHALHMVVFGRSSLPREAPGAVAFAWLVPLTTPLLVSPASVAAAVSYGARYGALESVTACGLVLALTACALAVAPPRSASAAALGILNRFSGALLIAVATELAVDGVRSV
jgi:small neutral amino acid transporter SnatA (MarC family)